MTLSDKINYVVRHNRGLCQIIMTDNEDEFVFIKRHFIFPEREEIEVVNASGSPTTLNLADILEINLLVPKPVAQLEGPTIK